MKNNGTGQAAIWTPEIIRKMRSRLVSPAQRLIFEISLFTGERMGAITQLQVSDVYDARGEVKDEITFVGNTRKASKHGKASTRQVAIHPDLRFHFNAYKPPSTGFLFQSDSVKGHISLRAVDKYWRAIFDELGLSGFSTHSSRRWVINSLRSAGIEIVTIAETMNMNVNTVRHYLDHNPIECKRAIATLTT
jgi:integrase/recombinase XerD